MKNSRWLLCGLGAVVLLASVVALRHSFQSQKPVAKETLPSPAVARAAPSAAPRPEAEPAIAGLVPTAPTPNTTAASPPPSPLAPTPVEQFNAWAEQYAAAQPSARTAQLGAGEALAQARYREIVQWMQTDPKRALAMALPYRLYHAMPASLSNFLEHPISARGQFEVIQSTPLPGHANEEPPPQYRVTIQKKSYQAYVYGARERHLSHSGVPLHGVAAHDERGRPILALSEDVLRIVSPEEAQALIRQKKIPSGTPCALCAAPALPGQETIADYGGEYHTFCRPAHALKLNELASQAMSQVWPTRSAQPNTASGSLPAPPPLAGPTTSFTQGVKRLLYMPVIFADDPMPPESIDASQAIAASNNRFFKEGSYGIVDWLTTITPVLRLPQTKNYYGEVTIGTVLGGGGGIVGDATAVAASLGYPVGEYNQRYVVFPSEPEFTFGGRSDGLLNGGGGALTHELGHNFGLPHANYVDTSGRNPGPPTSPSYPTDPDSLLGHDNVNAPIRAGKPFVEEYGDIYDVMGSGSGHFNVIFKNQMHWLNDQFIRLVQQSETNRLYAFDTPMIFDGRLYALRVHKDYDKEYWISVRQGIANNPWLANGVELMWKSASLGNVLIDGTATTSPGKNDSALLVGRTLNDPAANVLITPVAQGGAGSNKWVDVVVNLGPFPSNHPPTVTLTASASRVAVGAPVTFTATAQDPDGDPVAYNWDFGDLSFGANGPVMSKTYTNDGQFVVRCDVSDMKGGLGSAYVVVMVGAPTTFTMSGRVADINGNPVPGVRVHYGGTPPSNVSPPNDGSPPLPSPVFSSSYRYSYTDSQGNYTIGNLPAGTYTNQAFLYGYKTEPLSLDPQQLIQADAIGLDHIATPLPKVTITRRADALEDGEESGGFIIRRDGDVSRDLLLRYMVTGTAVQGVDYLLFPGALSTNTFYLTNLVTVTNSGVIVTNTVISTNQVILTNSLLQTMIPAGSFTTNLDVTGIRDTNGTGNKSVIVTMLLATNDFRITTFVTNVVLTNMVTGTNASITNIIVTTNSTFVSVTNTVTIPGWEVRSVPRGPDTVPMWFQTYPTYVLAGGEATVFVIDEDPPALPTVSILALDPVAEETRGDSAMLLFARTGSPITNDLVIHYTVVGTASNGVDYSYLPGVVTIPAGQDSVLVPVLAINDRLVNSNVTATLTITPDPAHFKLGSGSATITFEDNDLPLVTMYASDPVASQTNSNNGVVTVSRTGDLTDDLMVNYFVTGTAVSGRDYQPLSQTVTIPAGSISTDITIIPLITNIPGAKTVIILLSDNPAYSVLPQNSAMVTILDTLPTVTLSVVNNTINEGGTPGLFRVTRTGSTSNALTVFFALGGTADEYYDYAPVGTNVVIPAGTNTADITISAAGPYDDLAHEASTVTGEKTVIIELQPGPNYNLGDLGQIGGTIRFADDETASDLPAVGFMLKESWVREDAGAVAIYLKCSANPAQANPIKLEYRITGGSAVAGTNYVALSNGVGLLLFTNYVQPNPPLDFLRPEGSIQGITIPIVNDGVVKSNLFFNVQLFYSSQYVTNYSYVTNTGTNGVTVFTNTLISLPPTNALIGDYPFHRVNIIDVGATAVGVVADVPYAYEAGFQAGRFMITRTGPTGSPLTVYYGIGGTAAAGSDYVALTTNGVLGVATIPAGTNSVVVPVAPIANPALAVPKTVVLTLLSRPGYSLGSSSAQVLLVPDNGAVQFSAATYKFYKSAGNAAIAVQRSGDASRAFTVDYQVLNGTAINGTDYRGTNGTLQFAAGDTVQTINVELINDNVAESDKTVNLVLANSTSDVLLGGQSTATLVILNDKTAFQFATNQVTVAENGTNALIGINRVGLTTATNTVTFFTSDGTATNSVHYQSVSTNLVFAPGETNKVVPVRILDNVLFDGNKTVSLQLSNAGPPAFLGSPSSTTLRILDDESSLAFSAANYNVTEWASNVEVVVVRSGGTVNPVLVDYFTVDGTASNGVDYVAQRGTLRFNGDQYAINTNNGQLVFVAGETSKSILIPILDDQLVEGDESFRVVLTNARAATLAALPGSTVLGATTNITVTILTDEAPGFVDLKYNAGLGANGRVWSVAIQPDGMTVFGGEFTSVDNVLFNRIARLQTVGVYDRYFNPGFGANSNVYAVVVSPEGKILIGGAFTNVDNVSLVGLARLLPSGDLDPTFTPFGGPNGPVRAIALQSDGGIVIGGNFTGWGIQTRSRLARLHSDGTLDAAYVPLNGVVNAIAVQPDGQLVVGGAFTGYLTNNYLRLARLTLAGIDASFRPSFDAAVNTVAIQPDLKIVVGGAFRFVNGVQQPYLARLMPDGTLDPTFNTGTGPNAAVNSLAVIPADGSIVIGGDFTTYNFANRRYFARLLASGDLDTLFDIGTGADGTVHSVAVQADYDVVIGGDFTSVNGLRRLGVARIHGGIPPVTSISQFSLAGGQSALTFNSQAGLLYTLSTSTNLVNWTSVTSALAIGPVSTLVDTKPGAAKKRFYRIAITPQ